MHVLDNHEARFRARFRRADADVRIEAGDEIRKMAELILAGVRAERLFTTGEIRRNSAAWREYP